MATAQAALQRLCDTAAEVSAHYLLGEDGTLWQLVAEDRRAWHAGAGSWKGLSDINSRSIGIELANCGDHPFPEPQMAVLEDLLAGLLRRWVIPPGGVIGHSDMAPGRKRDPGPRFDWARLEWQGLASRPRAPRVEGEGWPAFRAAAQAAGWSEAAADDDLLAAVRLRLRPGARGPLAQADLAALAGAGA